MIRDPSDGSVREKVVEDGLKVAQELVNVIVDQANERLGFPPVIDTSTSGLPITKAKAEYLERLEESRKWLEDYVRKTIG